MRAILQERYGDPDALRLAEVAVSEPGDGEVLVRVQAASLNTADLDHLHGRPPLVRLATGLRAPRFQRTGLDLAGQVEAVGSGVTRLQPGDEVWADLNENRRGAFAEYVCDSEAAFVPDRPRSRPRTLRCSRTPASWPCRGSRPLTASNRASTC